MFTLEQHNLSFWQEVRIWKVNRFPKIPFLSRVTFIVRVPLLSFGTKVYHFSVPSHVDILEKISWLFINSTTKYLKSRYVFWISYNSHTQNMRILNYESFWCFETFLNIIKRDFPCFYKFRFFFFFLKI